jgi:hypothetical protein
MTIWLITIAIIAVTALPAFASLYSDNLDAYYPMDVQNSGSPPTTPDMSIHNYTANVNGSAAQGNSVNTGLGQAYYFPGGTGNNLQLQSTSYLSYEYTQPFTISFWFKVEDRNDITFLSKSWWNWKGFYIATTGGDVDSIFLNVCARQNGPDAHVLRGSLLEYSTIPLDTWYYFAAVYNGDWNYPDIYINGALSNGYASKGAYSPDSMLNAYYPTIGGWCETNSGNLNGALDDVAFWGRVLSANEISGIYTAGIAGESLGGLLDAEAAPEPATVAGVVLVAVGVIIRGIKRRGKLMLVSSS